MKSRSNLFISIFLFISFLGFAQQREPLVGKIHADSLNGAAINILNLTSGTGTTNDNAGNFEVAVRVQDTLLFSSVQYEPREIIISEELLKKAFLNVYLMEKINELGTVNISNVGLSGNLKQDLANIGTINQADFGFALPREPRPTSIERKLETSSGIQKDKKGQAPSLVTVSFDGILNRLNGRIEMLQKARENEERVPM